MVVKVVLKALKVIAKLAATKEGRKALKGTLIGLLCLMFLPVILFAPIASFVTGISNFFSGEEGESLNDSSDLDALLNDTFVITETQYYKQIEKARSRHLEKIVREQQKVAEQVKEDNKYTVITTSSYTDSEGNTQEEESESTVYPDVAVPAPIPPIVSVLAYFCTTEQVQIGDTNRKLSIADIQGFYQKINKQPFKVECENRDSYVVTVEYMTDDEITKLLLTDGTLKDEGDADLFRVSIERLTQMVQEAGGTAYDGTPSGNISDTAIAQQIWTYFKGRGWSDYACAAIIGNFEAECSLKPNLEETGGTGIGLGQWSLGRRDGFLNWLHSNGKDIKDINAQCEYLIVENTWYAGNVLMYNSGGKMHRSKANTLSEFGTYTYQQLSDAVDDFLWHWESPNYQKAQQDRRQGAAQDAYNMFAGGGKPIYTGSYSQIKQSFFPGGKLPASAEAMAPYLVDISFKNTKGVTKYVTVNRNVAADLLDALTKISQGGYEIRQIGGYAWKIKTNSTSGDRSAHSYGLAIDINWDYGNPQVIKGVVMVGTPYGSALSMKNGDLTVSRLKACGWKWGGNWTSSKDYMHYSVPGD